MSRKTAERTTGAVVTAVLRTAAAEVADTMAAAVVDEPDGVHQHRVRVRRLRSVLAGFRDTLDARAADSLRSLFKEWGTQLGVVRDIEVRADVAEAALESAGIDDPEMTVRLVDTEREAYANAHARLVELSQSPRALERTRALEQFAAEAIVLEPEGDAAPLLAAVLRTQARRVRKAVGRLDGTPESYHDVRKAARRLRYVAEAIGEAVPGLYDSQVAGLAEAGDALHDALGQHRDALLFAEHVEREAARAARAGEQAALYSRIEEGARDHAAKHLEALPHALRLLKTAASDLPDG